MARKKPGKSAKKVARKAPKSAKPARKPAPKKPVTKTRNAEAKRAGAPKERPAKAVKPPAKAPKRVAAVKVEKPAKAPKTPPSTKGEGRARSTPGGENAAYKANIFGTARIAMPSDEPRKTPIKPAASSAAAADHGAPMQPLKVKTTLTKKQLDTFREFLLKRRAEILGSVQSLESEALRQNAAGDLSHVPQHIADMGTDTYDQEFSLRLAATEREMLGEIDAALKRIEEGTYGMCEVSGKPIGIARLEAKPWARVTIDVARERDRLPVYKR